MKRTTKRRTSSAVALTARPTQSSLADTLLLDLADRLDPPVRSELELVWQAPPDIVDWAHGNFIDPVSNKLIRLEDHQQRLLRAIFQLIWTKKVHTVVWSEVKKSGKTSVAGLVGAYWANYVEPPNLIISVANDKEQAAGRIYAAMMPTLARLGWEVPERMPLMENKTTGSKVSAISTNYAGEAGANYGLTLWSELWAYTCLSEDTEIFTKQGWKTYKTISRQDSLATLSSDGYLEWQSPTDITVQKYVGKMLELTHRRASLCVTPNHRLYGHFWRSGKRPVTRPGFKLAEEAVRYAQGTIPQQAKWRGKTIKKIKVPVYETSTTYWESRSFNAKDFAELLGYFISDGCTSYSQSGSKEYPSLVAIACREDNFKEKNTRVLRRNLQKCLKRLGIHYLVRPWGVWFGDAQIANYFGQLGRHANEKHLPEGFTELSGKVLRIFLDAYFLGDGEEVRETGAWHCKTVSPVLRDQLFEIGLKSGYSTRVDARTKKSGRENICYSLSFYRTEPVWQKPQWKEIDYKGIVWCVSVPNTTIFVKRKSQNCWVGNSESRKRLWEEMTQVPTRQFSVRWVETYAGYLGESELLWELYTRAFKDGKEDEPLGERIPGLEDLPVWYIPGSSAVVLWSHEPRMPWQTPEFVESQRNAPGMRPNTFLRLWGNYWVSSESVFIDPTQWDVLEDCEPLNPEGDVRPIVLGVDASTKHDSSAIVAAVWNPDGKAPDIVGAWEYRPRYSEAADKVIVDLSETIEAKLVELFETYQVLGVYYDQLQLHSIMTNLQKKYDSKNARKVFVDFPQNSGRIESDQAFYVWITERKLRRIRHVGLRTHVLNAVAEETERGFRLDKEKTQNKIDLAVAASMACYGVSVRQRPFRKFISLATVGKRAEPAQEVT